MVVQPLQLLLSMAVAWCFGKLAGAVRLPPILGWLVAGMVLGPHLLNVFSQPLMDSLWYTTLEHILECTLGLMIGTELLWNKLKRAGRQIFVTTITESLGTFLVVSTVCPGLLDAGRAHLPGLPAGWHLPGHCPRPLSVHRQPDEDRGAGHQHPHPHGRPG